MVAGRLKRETLDVEVEAGSTRRACRGIRRTVARRLRLVAVRFLDSAEYRFKLARIDPDSLDVHAVGWTYAARQESEIIFKELKSHCLLEHLSPHKVGIVETLLLGAVMMPLVSRRSVQTVQERLRCTAYKMSEPRSAAIFAAAAPPKPDVVVLPPEVWKRIAPRVESTLLRETQEPNRSRQLLYNRVECDSACA